VIGYYNAGDRMKYWGKLGAFWGGFWGLLFGSAFFLIPGVGPLLVAGPLVGWIVGHAPTKESGGGSIVGKNSAGSRAQHDDLVRPFIYGFGGLTGKGAMLC
jgi:hypothetical protein